MAKRVLIIAGNGFSGLMNEYTSSPSLMHIIQDIYAPLSINGRNVSKLSELRGVLQHTDNSVSHPKTSPSATSITQTTGLNGVVLYNYLSKRGFLPSVINDLEQDQDLFTETVTGDLVAAVISTTFLPYRQHVDSVAHAIRQANPTVPIIVGGPMVYMSHSVFQKKHSFKDYKGIEQLYFFFEVNEGIDYYVLDRYGLKTLVNLLGKLFLNEPVNYIPNLAVTSGQGIRFTPLVPETYDIADEFVDWNQIPDTLMRETVSTRGSLGCPFDCNFCNFKFFSPRMKLKPRDMLMQELNQLAGRKTVKHVSFVDDNLLLNQRQVETFCQTLIDNQYSFTWSSFIRPDSINTNNIKLLARSGANRLTFGVESGDPTILANMNKKENLDHTLTVINGLGELDISTSTTLMVGFPGETIETVDRTIDFLNQYRSSEAAIHWFSPFIFMMLPEIRIEKDREKYNLEGLFLNWKHRTMDSLEAATQLKRMMLDTTEVFFPYSNEHLFADQILNISPFNAITIIKLIAKHVKNQIRYKDNPTPQLLERNSMLADQMKEILA